MKKFFILILLCICTLAFAGCKPDANPVTGNSDSLHSSGGPAKDGTAAVRIVDGADSGILVLAGSRAEDVYTVNAAKIPIYLDGAPADVSALEDGMTAELSYRGAIPETYPARFEEVRSISVYSKGTEKNPGGDFYDLCGLYLQVLQDLWERDPALNAGVSYISVDLSNAPGNLTDGEKAAIAWIFARRQNAEGLSLSYADLKAQGYLTEVEMSADYPTEKPKPYQWKNGVLFSITADKPDTDKEKLYSLPVIEFDAQKWRSPRGAYYFSDCKAVWPETGAWSDYSIDREAIS